MLFLKEKTALTLLTAKRGTSEENKDHLFGATSSPSVANFSLRKTALLHKDGFDKVVVVTVNRNMHVDDIMKSTSTTERAISLASQLRKLREKDRFRLTEW